MERWNGRIALVIGANEGMGTTICKELMRHGMIVLGCGIKEAIIGAISCSVDVASAPGRLHVLKCDLSNETEILEMFKKIRKEFGHVDVCINNSGLDRNTPLMSGKTTAWRHMMDVNIMGSCICTQESLTLMKENGINDGQIIYMNSILGHTPPKLQDGDYSGFYYGTMRMLRTIAECLRQQLKSEHCSIRIASISVGLMETIVHQGLLFQFLRNFGSSGNEWLQYQDVADAVTHILSTPSHVNVEDIILQTNIK